jgi:hypothetical protein
MPANADRLMFWRERRGLVRVGQTYKGLQFARLGRIEQARAPAFERPDGVEIAACEKILNHMHVFRCRRGLSASCVP